MGFMLGMMLGSIIGALLGGAFIWEYLIRDAIKNGVAGYDRDGTPRWMAVQKDDEKGE